VLAVLAVIAMTLVVLTAIEPRTPLIVGEGGELVPGSVASLEKIELGGVDQWILIRGRSSSNPVLLFLHGGPGMPAMFLRRAFGRELEKGFLVVHWDQRGAGKSYSRNIPVESMNVRQLMSDAEDLIELLRKRYGERGIYLVGHSWGSYLGMLLVRERPELFRAYVGVGQITDPERAGVLADVFIVRKAREEGEDRAIAQLGSRGELAREKWLTKFGGVLYGHDSYRPLLRQAFRAPEYSVWDALKVAQGFRFSSEHMRYNVIVGALMDEVTAVRVPVYFFQGRHDYVTPSQLTEEYLSKLQAPSKKMVCFENSAHYPFIEEPQRFALEMAKVLEETQPR